MVLQLRPELRFETSGQICCKSRSRAFSLFLLLSFLIPGFTQHLSCEDSPCPSRDLQSVLCGQELGIMAQKPPKKRAISTTLTHAQINYVCVCVGAVVCACSCVCVCAGWRTTLGITLDAPFTLLVDTGSLSGAWNSRTLLGRAASASPEFPSLQSVLELQAPYPTLSSPQGL